MDGFPRDEIMRLWDLFGQDLGPYANVDAAPFHAPIATDQIRRFVLKPGAPDPDNGQLDIGPGWILSAFSISTQDGRRAKWGWVRDGLFAIDERDSHDGSEVCAVVSHVPTGLSIATADHAEEAVKLVASIAECINWRAVDKGRDRDIIMMCLAEAGWSRVGATRWRRGALS